MELKIYILVFKYLIFDYVGHGGGVEALIGYNIRPISEYEYPSVACLVKYYPDDDWKDILFCTGTFISWSHVLTAEHCFENIEQAAVVAGSHNVQDGQRFYPIWWMSYDQWVLSRTGSVSDALNDVLIIKIVGLTDRIVPSNLSYIYPNTALYNTDVEIVGCGTINSHEFPRVLHTASVKVMSQGNCINLVSRLEGLHLPLSEHIICTAGNPYTFLEHGDSGGPIFYGGNVIGVNIAVCPKMKGSFHPSKVNIHMNINYYQDFVSNLLNN